MDRNVYDPVAGLIAGAFGNNLFGTGAKSEEPSYGGMAPNGWRCRGTGERFRAAWSAIAASLCRSLASTLYSRL